MKHVVIATTLTRHDYITVRSYAEEFDAISYMEDQLESRSSFWHILQSSGDVISIWKGGFWYNFNGEALQMELKHVHDGARYILLTHTAEDASATIEGEFTSYIEAVAALDEFTRTACADWGYWETERREHRCEMEDGNSLLHAGIYEV